MLNRFARTLLACTATAPILLTYSFMIWLKKKSVLEIVSPLVVAILLVTICICILKFASKRLQITHIKIVGLSPADGESLGFIIAYLLPLVTTSLDDINYFVFILFFIFIMAMILITNMCSTNPLLNFAGYHFYQVTTIGQINYLLITKKVLINVNQVTQVVKLTEYIALEV